MRKALFLFAPVVASVLVFACEDDSIDQGPATFVFDGGNFDGNAPQDDGATPDGGDAGPQAITVTVFRGGAPRQGIEVVFHDASGAVLGTGATGADGIATAPAALAGIAQVSALLGVTGHRQILTWTAVAAGDALVANDVDDNAYSSSYNVNPQGNFVDGGATTYAAAVANCRVSDSEVLPVSLFLSRSCVGTTNSVMMTAQGAAGILAYAYTKTAPPPPDDGGTAAIDVGPWLATGSAQVIVANAPTAALAARLYEISGGAGLPNQTNAAILDGGASFLVAPGFADALQGAVQARDGNSSRIVATRTGVAASVTVDYAKALPELSSATLDSTDPKRPQVTWTAASPMTGAAGGAISIPFFIETSEESYDWILIVPPDATTVKAPALPTDAAAWLPALDGGTPNFDSPEVLFVGSSLISGYAPFRQQVGRLASQPSTSLIFDAVLPLAGTLSTTDYQQTPE